MQLLVVIDVRMAVTMVMIISPIRFNVFFVDCFIIGDPPPNPSRQGGERLARSGAYRVIVLMF